MNLMPQVAAMLGVEIGEFFRITNLDGIYRFSEHGLEFESDREWLRSGVLNELIAGKREIIKATWLPKEGESYFFIEIYSSGQAGIFRKENNGGIVDQHNIQTGNCFKERYQAEANEEAYKRYISEKAPDFSWREDEK